MTTQRRDRALLALATAGVLGAATSAGTFALWSVTASGEGTIGAERFSETASDGPAESPSEGPAASPSEAAGESATDGPVESVTDGPTDAPADGPDEDAAGGPTQDTPAPADGPAEAEAPDGPADVVRLDLPAELLDDVNANGRGASVLEHDLTGDEIATFRLTLVTDVPDLTWHMAVRTVTAPEMCAVTDVELPVDDGTPVEVELDASTLLCLELATATTERSGRVSASGSSGSGDVSADQDWATTVHGTLTTDDLEVVLTPVNEVTP